MIDTSTLATPSAEAIHFLSSEEFGKLDRNRRGLTIREIDSPIRSQTELFAALAKALRFPDYFGSNWDAVDECFRDLKADAGDGIVLVLRHADTLFRSDPRSAGSLIEAWLHSADEWRAMNVGFHLVFVW